MTALESQSIDRKFRTVSRANTTYISVWCRGHVMHIANSEQKKWKTKTKISFSRMPCCYVRAQLSARRLSENFPLWFFMQILCKLFSTRTEARTLRLLCLCYRDSNPLSQKFVVREIWTETVTTASLWSPTEFLCSEVIVNGEKDRL